MVVGVGGQAQTRGYLGAGTARPCHHGRRHLTPGAGTDPTQDASRAHHAGRGSRHGLPDDAGGNHALLGRRIADHGAVVVNDRDLHGLAPRPEARQQQRLDGVGLPGRINEERAGERLEYGPAVRLQRLDPEAVPAAQGALGNVRRVVEHDSHREATVLAHHQRDTRGPDVTVVRASLPTASAEARDDVGE